MRCGRRSVEIDSVRLGTGDIAGDSDRNTAKDGAKRIAFFSMRKCANSTAHLSL